MFLPARCQWRPRPLWPPLSSPTAAPLHSLQLRGSGLWALCLRFLSPGEIAGPQLQYQSQEEGSAFSKTALPRSPPARLNRVLLPWIGSVQSQAGELRCGCPLLAEPCQLPEKHSNASAVVYNKMHTFTRYIDTYQLLVHRPCIGIAGPLLLFYSLECCGWQSGVQPRAWRWRSDGQVKTQQLD